MSDVYRALSEGEKSILLKYRALRDAARQRVAAAQAVEKLRADAFDEACRLVCQTDDALMVDLDAGVIRTADGSDAPEPPQPRHGGEVFRERAATFRALREVGQNADTGQ